MTESDREDFAIVINALAATFRQEPSKALLYGYWMGLDDLPVESVKLAGAKAMRSCKFMPTCLELRELAGIAKPEDRAVLAWDAFERAVVREGAYRSVTFDDPIINATVHSLGGWQRCCGLPTEEFDKWLVKDFVKNYQAFYNAGVSEEQCQPLVGMHEQNNLLVGAVDLVKAPILVITGLPPAPNAPQIEHRKRNGKTLEIGSDIGRMP